MTTPDRRHRLERLEANRADGAAPLTVVLAPADLPAADWPAWYVAQVAAAGPNADVLAVRFVAARDGKPLDDPTA